MTTTNGFDHQLQPVQAVPVVGTQVEIDPKKLGTDGHRMLGQIDAVSRWAVMFSVFRDNAIDLNERRVLTAVIDALAEDAEGLRLKLTRYALKRGGAKLTNPEDEGSAE